MIRISELQKAEPTEKDEIMIVHYTENGPASSKVTVGQLLGMQQTALRRKCPACGTVGSYDMRGNCGACGHPFDD